MENLIQRPHTSNTKKILVDEDGDILVQRTKDYKQNTEASIIIEHQLSTDLANVGMQMWRGSFYLSDYLFDVRNKNLMNEICTENGGVWLELGAGVGLVSIVSALVQPKYHERHIFTTDIAEVISLTRRNIQRNVSDLSSLIDVFPLNVNQTEVSRISECDVELILAADLIYDDSLTDDIIKTIQRLILQQYSRQTPKKIVQTSKLLTCLFSIEKRFNFTIRKLDVSAHAYDYFLQRLGELNEIITTLYNELSILYSTLDTKVHQWFCYERSKDLVIIKIEVMISQ